MQHLKILVTMVFGGLLLAGCPKADQTKLTFAQTPVQSQSVAQVVVIGEDQASETDAITSVSLTGPNAADFAIVADTGEKTLKTDQKRTLSIVFKPTTSGTFSASVVVAYTIYGSPGRIKIDVAGTAVAQPPHGSVRDNIGGDLLTQVGTDEKTIFTVVLAHAGANKTMVVKKVQDLTGIGLKNAKILVESAPSVVSEGVSADVAAKMAAELREVGAEVDIK